MPGLNGLELLKKVKSSNSNVRTIHMSAYNFEDELFQKYMKHDIIDSFIAKPLTVNQLCQRVRDEFEVYPLPNQSSFNDFLLLVMALNHGKHSKHSKCSGRNIPKGIDTAYCHAQQSMR